MTDTIVAQATPPGRGGVGIIRISGPKSKTLAEKITGKTLKKRQAEYLPFKTQTGEVLDQGIALFFQSPHSFTGEDVLELQGHGGPVIMDMLLQEILTYDGVRLAHPGEFTERAFLNDKLDLTQAEAIADLIDASSTQAAKSALQSLQGVFSDKINTLVEQVIHLRMYVEAAIDFPDEEIDFLADGKIKADLHTLCRTLQGIQQEASQGALMREGMKVVIAGKPNAGKSSLLNSLSGKDSAIVTEIAGTTRDVLKEQIHIDGMPLHIIDTAGLRQSDDHVEQIGIARAWQEIEQADRVLLVIDGTETPATDPQTIWPEFIAKIPQDIGITLIRNKIDLTQEHQANDSDVICISAKTGQGVDTLRQHLKQCMGYTSTQEGALWQDDVTSMHSLKQPHISSKDKRT